MSFIRKPKVEWAGQRRNPLGLTIRDYEGGMSTLCAGCGHDSVTAALVQAFWELSIKPEQVIKMSGIGCSSKTPAYFLSGAHGFNSVHGRMPSVATGALAAHRDLIAVGISGDGDSLSIGMGQFAHAVRRNLNLLYIIENNGVYGLTKGQFSASADPGSKSKAGIENRQQAIDPVAAAISLGGSFAARSFSGDKQQLVPLIKAGLAHPGCAVLDVISPCVTFNDHEGSTKSYAWTRENHESVTSADLVEPAEAIEANYEEGEELPVRLHDDSVIRFRKLEADYDPGDRAHALEYLERHRAEGKVVTGLLYLDQDLPEFHQLSGTARQPLRDTGFEHLNPGADALETLQEKMR
ncbi:2-oxoacid:ferredoxin oxidoreductase subunit beta [Wenzhouxiangella sp. AB-CW3]|uniref:2-oxoacid:ferredoxin oxidoreductase subunit beta n=1 Tax=Wenzhouxiangella sp. AB-CW3 TaxID=2771012 RepID=UPI00168B517C|nr:2-oxoacid:ferredoxin oxidoreductase subunit beta [Wenzhouxiangella sp. AB-CW3]QOC23861.1 2-oxoacid:ferredoxin oxidoreductase subunit beta [Wenzhouxiangella sp. AB-CW3]